MRKILVVITTGFVSWGGLTTVAMNYYRAMDKQDLQVDFASSNETVQSLLEELEQNGSAYIRFPDRRKHVIKYMFALYQKLKCGGYNVIHVHGNSATMVFDLFPAWLLKVEKRIAHVHNVQSQYRVLHTVLKPLMNLLANRRLAVSDEAGWYLYGDRKFIVLNNAIDVDHYRFRLEGRLRHRAEWKIPDSALLVGTAGKMNNQKNQKFLVEVFSHVLVKRPDARLLIVGDGELRGEIEEQIRALGISDSCILTGMQEDIADYLSAMDVFVFPSLYEGLSLALLEAQASGLKCFYTDSLTERGIITEDCSGFSLNCMEEWVNAIIDIGEYDRERTSSEGIKKLTEKCFNIRYEAEQLRKWYV